MYDEIIIDEVLEIIELDEEDTIDIEVTGNRLFFANGILTHNSGYGNGDFDLSNTSESIGLPQTVDSLFGLISSEELESMGQLMVKQLKNRWGDLSYYRRFVIGIDRSKMKLYNLEDDAQSNIRSETQSDNKDFATSKFSNKKKKLFDAEGLR